MAVNKGDLTSLLQYRRGIEHQSSSNTPSELDSNLIKPVSPASSSTTQNNLSSTSTHSTTTDNSSPPKVGRPRGRRSNPDTENTTLILNKKLKAEVIYKLSLDNLDRPPGHKTSLSDLVEQLLLDWNQSQ